MSPTVFNLPDSRTAKAGPGRIDADEAHLAAVATALDAEIAKARALLERTRLQPGGRGRAAMERDREIHRLSRQVARLERVGADICLGRMTPVDGAPCYIGRIGLLDAQGDPLLIDWRTPAAEPFFAATHAAPSGLASRRRYRWAQGRVVDYWDEVFDGDLDSSTALDDQSAFIASLAASRTDRMRDVLATIAADQDAIVRAPSQGALVVDGGPGTGKTVVALHRAAFLLYEEPRLEGRGGVLVIGPHRGYLNYIADVLPNLGEEGVVIATLEDLVPQGADAVAEPDPEVARLKASGRLLEAVDAAVAFYEVPPSDELLVETSEGSVDVTADDWAEAFRLAFPEDAHNEVRETIWDALLEALAEKDCFDEDVDPYDIKEEIARDVELRSTFETAWPILHAPELVSDLWSVPAYLALCAPGLTEAERRLLRRDEGAAWTKEDLPILDAMRRRLGDPAGSAVAQRRSAALKEALSYMDDVVEGLLASVDDPESPLPYLNRDSIRAELVDEDAVEQLARDRLAGPFGHIIVDEAQELTDAQWQMILARCPSRSVTVVGDRAQARAGFPEPWEERLTRVGFRSVTERTLSINYRTPRQVMEAAEPVIRAAVPEANVPVSVREGLPVRHGRVDDLDTVLDAWLAGHDEGVACVVGDPGRASSGRVSSLAPELVKGLEFDLVILVWPHDFGDGLTGAVDRYVAMTRTTGELVILT